jgi:predicted HTH transcriptional regulator
MAAENGTDVRKAPHSAVLQFVRENNAPFVSTQEVAEQFPEVSSRTIRIRLNDLVDRGNLESQEVGGNAKVWYVL